MNIAHPLNSIQIADSEIEIKTDITILGVELYIQTLNIK